MRRCGRNVGVSKDCTVFAQYSRLENGSLSEYTAVLTDSDIAPTTAHRWQTVAQVPDEVFEEHVAEVKQEQRELTSAGLLRLAGEIKQSARG